MYTTLADLFKAICDSIRAIVGSSAPIKHQEIPETVNAIASEVDSQNELIEEIATILESKASAYPHISYDSTTGTLTITEVS